MDDGDTTSLISDQILLIATVIGAVATLPTLIEFLIDRRKRKERIALSLDDLDVDDLDVRLAGLDVLLQDIADLIDRAKNPEAYASLQVGNEILIVGPSLSGKKALAYKIAKEAGMDRLIVVYNARNADALAKAKSLIQHYRRQKVMLLLPRLDNVVGIVLTLPGTPVAHAREHPLSDDARRLLGDVGRFYLAATKAAGFTL